MTSTKTCLECQGPNETKGKFCGTKCRKDFNNRRAVRGAQLYDAFLALRYDRKKAAALGIDLTFLSRMAEAWAHEDEGRQSWRDPYEFAEENKARFSARYGRVSIGRN